LTAGDDIQAFVIIIALIASHRAWARLQMRVLTGI
jgi:hypothetical protein